MENGLWEGKVKAENYRCSAAFIYKHRIFRPPWRAQSIEESSFGGPAEYCCAGVTNNVFLKRKGSEERSQRGIEMGKMTQAGGTEDYQ